MSGCKVFFQTLGCKVNQYESEAMQKLFEANGYELAQEISEADVIVVNTCTVTAVSSQKFVVRPAQIKMPCWSSSAATPKINPMKFLKLMAST